jgi:uncharacterized protein YbjT (DUF2867 family)
MRITVIGGAGHVGSKVVENLRSAGHQVVVASRRSGVDVITGAGLEGAVEGADVVIDVANPLGFEDEIAIPFFETATANLMAAESAAGVALHIGVSIVGAERLPDSGYFRAKLAQERQVKASGLAYTLLRSTQFFEFLPEIVRSGTVGDTVRLSPARVQFIAASDVASAVADLAVRRPLNDVVEVAGPEPARLDVLVQDYMTANRDHRPVVADPGALYFGSRLGDETLMAGDIPRFGHTDFLTWLERSRRHPAPAASL